MEKQGLVSVSYMQDTLFDYSVSVAGTEEMIFTQSVFAYMEYSQISLKMTEACFMLWWNKINVFA